MKSNQSGDQQVVEVILKVSISRGSKLEELIQAASRIGLVVMMKANQGKPMPKALREMYDEADQKLKTALMAEFAFNHDISSVQWDTAAYLSEVEHLMIMTPEG